MSEGSSEPSVVFQPPVVSSDDEDWVKNAFPDTGGDWAKSAFPDSTDSFGSSQPDWACFDNVPAAPPPESQAAAPTAKPGISAADFASAAAHAPEVKKAAVIDDALLDDDSEVDHTLFLQKDVKVFKIPPRPSVEGYKAGEWTDGDIIFWARLRVTEHPGDIVSVRLEDPQKAELFAQCIINPDDDYQAIVEPALDSSRYFVLRVTDEASGQHAFVGIGFVERGPAFDFSVALQDHRKHLRAKKIPVELEFAKPLEDLSLKEGQKITISIKGHKAKPRAAPSAEPAAGTSGGLSSFLPPPPSGSRAARN